MNLPNKLTVARVVMAAIFVVVMSFDYVGCLVAGFFLFMAGSITDHLDGKIARARGLVTNFGKLLDPVADKVLVTAAFVMLLGVKHLWIPPWTIMAIISREFLVTGARSLAASEGAVVGANVWGKIKTVLQMGYVYCFLFLAIVARVATTHAPIADRFPDGLPLFLTGLEWASMIGIVLVAVYTVASGAQFTMANWKALNLKDL